jgi:16S rRNA (guanine1516-N2)-methyltransferase
MTNDSKLSLIISVSSTTKSKTYLQKAEKLAEDLNLIFSPDISLCQTDLVLCYTEQGLKLVEITLKKKINPVLFVDFIHGKNGYRFARDCTIKQPLARAVGIKSGIRPVVLDATAGLGGDSFVLATLGCKMTLCERNPIMRVLLSDGINRALSSPVTGEIFSENIQLLKTDSITFLKSDTATKGFYNTIYLDPMYPHRTSSALGKKNMRVIRQLVGDDPDFSKLIEAAESYSPKRIVVKRSKNAPAICSKPVDHVISMKSSRFDIYFPKQSSNV